MEGWWWWWGNQPALSEGKPPANATALSALSASPPQPGLVHPLRASPPPTLAPPGGSLIHSPTHTACPSASSAPGTPGSQPPASKQLCHLVSDPALPGFLLGWAWQLCVWTSSTSGDSGKPGLCLPYLPWLALGYVATVRGGLPCLCPESKGAGSVLFTWC